MNDPLFEFVIIVVLAGATGFLLTLAEAIQKERERRYWMGRGK